MSKCIAIMGESGSGKTTSLRNLPPKETYYIDCDKKGLSWKGWRTQYNEESHNYTVTNEPSKVLALMKNISEKATHIKYLVIDTINGIMVGDEMRRAKEKGYDKWMDLAQSVWDIAEVANTLRNDLTVIILAHSQTERDESGYNFTRIKTSGRKVDKIVLESKFTTVLLAKGNDGKYLLETKANHSTAKTPFGAFEEDEIENDIMLVIKALEDF